MRKGLVGILCILVVLLCMCSVFAEGTNVLADEISVIVLERMYGDKVLVPLRDVFSKAGYDIYWNGNARSIKISKDFKSVVYVIGDDSVIVDNVKKSIDIAPKLLDGKTYVSVDAVEKGLGCEVKWDEDVKTITFPKDSCGMCNWQEILPLERTYQSKDGTGKVLANIIVKVPQIKNSMDRDSIEKINEYYRNEIEVIFDEYKKLLPSDVVGRMGDEIRYDASYIVTYNANDILSVVMICKNKGSVNVKCDVFDVSTGEKLELHDIIGVDKSGIDKFKLNALSKYLKRDVGILAEDIMFFIDNGDLVLVVNRGVDVLEYRIDKKNSRKLLKNDLYNTFNYDEEILAKRVACGYCRQRVRFVDKTIIDGHECYVFEGCSKLDHSIVGVDRYREIVYTLTKQGGVYAVISKDNVNDNIISNREAIDIVRHELNNNEYTYDLCGNMISDKDGKMYTVVRVKDTDGQVDKKIAVNRVDKSLYTEKSSGVANLSTNADGTVNAVGYFELDNSLTDVSSWGSTYLKVGSKMTIREDGSGLYYISDTGEKEGVEHFSLVNQDGRTYIEITNEDGEGSLKKGTRFLVEVREVDNKKCLYVYDEENNDVKQGNKYWRLVVEGYSVFEPMDERI